MGVISQQMSGGSFSRQYAQYLAFLIAFLLPLYLLTIQGGQFWMLVLIQIFIFGIVAMSYDLLFGYTGLLSFGHALFFGGSVYVGSILSIQYDINYLLMVPIAILLITLLSVVVGAISLQVSGVYFAMVTLAIAQMFHEAVLEFSSITGGDNGLYGINLSPIFGINPNERMISYYITLVTMILVFVFLKRLVESPFGRVIQGIRANEDRMEMLGINVFKYKLLAFIFSGFIASIAGALYPLYISFVDPALLHWLTTGDILLITIIGGIGTLWGPLLGSLFFSLIEEFLLSITEQWRLALGAIFVLFVLFAPKGMAGLLNNISRVRNLPKIVNKTINQWRN
jgi:branched-chain amino acid transport system permease protein